MTNKPEIINKIGTVPTSNYTPRDERNIIGVVEHWIVGSAKSALRTFANPNRRASAHFVIDDEGNIYQLLRLSDIAWHAGDYSYNTETIGIEHEGGYRMGNGELAEPTHACEDASARLQAWLSEQYGWGDLKYKKNVWRHRDIKPTSCPGSLDINRIITKANNILNNNNNNMPSTEDKLKETLEEFFTENQNKDFPGDKKGDRFGWYRGIIHEDHNVIKALKKVLNDYENIFQKYKELKKKDEERSEAKIAVEDKTEEEAKKTKLSELETRVDELEKNVDELNKRYDG